VNGDIEPVLVKDWILSKDGTTYDFFLKKGILFSNGKEFKAADVRFSFERIAGKDSINSWAAKVIEGYNEYVSGKSEHISGIDIVGDYHVRIKLSEPHQPFLSLLASVYFKVVAISNDKSNDAKLSLVGTGPYVLKEYLPKRKVTLIQNKNYHSPHNNIDVININIMPYKDAHRSFNEGRLDFLKYYPEGERIIRADARKMTAYQFTVWYNICNIDKYPCSDMNFRRALYHAIDRDKLAGAVGGHSISAKGFIPEGLMISYKPGSEKSLDIDKARGLLKKVKLPKDYVFPISLCYSTPNVRDVGRLYEEMMGAVGLKVDIKYYDYKEFYQRKRRGEYLFLQQNTIPSYADPDAMLYPYFFSKSGSNAARVKDVLLDELILSSRAEMDISKRVELNKRINDILIQKAYVIPNYGENVIIYMDKDLDVPAVSGLGSWFLEYKHLSWKDNENTEK